MRQDLYRVLGVAPTASNDEIRQAFRALARQYHPDANPLDSVASDQFMVINEAYRVLGTPQLRDAYDRALQLIRPESTPRADMGAGVSGASQRRTQAPAVGGTNEWPRQGTGAPRTPVLALSAIPGEASLAVPHEPTRCYLLTEVGAAGQPAVLDPLPLDLAIVIDRSNSMRGAKLTETKLAVLALLDELHANDLLTLVFFDDRAEVIADGETQAGRAGIEMALDRIVVRGSTRIAEGLDAALQRLGARQNRARAAGLILLTDGMTYGDEARCADLAAHARQMGISISALGLGTEWNRPLLDRLAAISGGSSAFIEDPRQVQPVFTMCVQRLRATLAASLRLTCEPVPGVRVVRATRVAPEIAEAFDGTTRLTPAVADANATPTDTAAPATASAASAEGAASEQEATGQAVTVEMGTLVGRPEIESTVVLWELLLDPAQCLAQNGQYTLARFSAAYWAPRQAQGEWEHLELVARLPVNTSGQRSPFHRDVRLALELITAYRLQARADYLVEAGQPSDAARHLTTSALRLHEAGEVGLAGEAQRAAKILSGPSGEEALAHGKTAALRLKYEIKNLSTFHRLRQQQK